MSSPRYRIRVKSTVISPLTREKIKYIHGWAWSYCTIPEAIPLFELDSFTLPLELHSSNTG